MSVKTALTEKITKEVLSRVISNLSSVSSSLSMTEIDAIVTLALESHFRFSYASNNDLGLCVDRLIDMCFFADVTTEEALENLYPTIRENDYVISETVVQVSEGIAKKITTPLYDVRVSLPKEAVSFTENVLSKVPPENTIPNIPLRKFTWGKLGTENGRTNAIMFARDRTTFFKRECIQSYDMENVLRILPYGDVKSVDKIPELRKTLITGLTNVITKIDDETTRNTLLKAQAVAVDIILSQLNYQKWVLELRTALTGKDISNAVIETTDNIDSVEEVLYLINTSLLTSLGDDVSLFAENILSNVEVVLQNIQLFRAAMLYYKENVLSTRVLLTLTVINEPAFDAFLHDGGTEMMVQDYVTYVKLNTHINIPGDGVSAETIRKVSERARHDVVTKSAKLMDMAAASRATSIQESVGYYLDVYNETQKRNGRYGINNRQGEHIHNRQRAIASLRHKALEDVALEYLVAMRDNPMTKLLYTSLKTELHSLVKTQSEMTQQDVVKSLCSAVVKTVLKQLSHRFSTDVAA